VTQALVSAVIPAYNAGRFLHEAIESVLAQTRPADEVIVVDDDSTDNTAEIARSFPVTLIRTPVNSGGAAARNAGIRAAKGSFIAQLDADDIWLPHHIEAVLPLLEQNPEVAVAFGHLQVFGTDVWEWPRHLPDGQPSYCFWESVRGSLVPHNAVILRRSMFEAVGGYRSEFRQGEDFDLFLRLSYRYPFACTYKKTALYRRHPGSSTILLPDGPLDVEYLSRMKFLEETNETPEFVQRFRRIGVQTWNTNMLRAWEAGNSRSLRLHLSRAHLVPGASEYVAAWQRKLRLLPLKRLWMRTPPNLRSCVRDLRMFLSRS
jgi:glycosyltransferase involved in cell wall biosynthesis